MQLQLNPGSHVNRSNSYGAVESCKQCHLHPMAGNHALLLMLMVLCLLNSCSTLDWHITTITQPAHLPIAPRS
jgi:hypothetical protein